MRFSIFFLFLFLGCNVKQPQNDHLVQQSKWSYSTDRSGIKIHENNCVITIDAVPEAHELYYTLHYKGKGFLEPLQLSSINGRLSAVLLSERTWVENDTIISKKIKPQNNTFQYTQINEKGPLQARYIISYQEEGCLQHLRFELDTKRYNYYLENFPYVSNKRSYHLSQDNMKLKEKMHSHLNQKLQVKRDIKGAESIFFSENELNIAGLIGHVNCIYDSNKLDIEVIWINHTELDLWIKSPSKAIKIDQKKVVSNWDTFEGKKAFGKGKRIIFKTSLQISTSPKKINLPLDHILFYDEELFFTEDSEMILDNSSFI